MVKKQENHISNKEKIINMLGIDIADWMHLELLSACQTVRYWSANEKLMQFFSCHQGIASFL